MQSDTHKVPHENLPHLYTYPEGVLRIIAWSWYLAGVVLIWLVYYVGGSDAFKTKQGLGIVVFGLLLILSGILNEWGFRNQPGRIKVVEDGLICTFSWGRQRHLHWDDIREVRRGASIDPKLYGAWGIFGLIPKDRILITSGLKGHKDLLRTIKAHATHCERFDPID